MQRKPDLHHVILIADEDVLIRNLLRTALQKDYEILVAANTIEALQLSRNWEGVVDVLLSDVDMPGMDGLSLYRELIRERPALKALFLCGTAPRALDFGRQPLPFLRKPFELQALRSLLKDMLAKKAIPEAPKTILVVDDNLKRRDRTGRILGRNGYRVLTAGGSKEAAVFTDSAAEIDLIISAVIMSGTGEGVDLAERVDASARGISTLLISHFDPALLQRLPGFSARPEFLANPFTAGDLLQRVRHLIRHPRR